MRATRLCGEAWVQSSEKRLMDILIASSVSPVAAPIGAIALGFSRIIDGKNALFTQERLGLGGEPFLVRKVRTMKSLVPGQEARGLADEITPLGHLLRPLGIDEIPQVLNVLKGDMSVVGPRAFPAASFEYMEAAVPRPLYEEWLDVYHSSRPGGLSTYQVEHRAGRVTHDQPMITKVLMDIADFRNASLRHDLEIMAKAIKVAARLLANGRPKIT